MAHKVFLTQPDCPQFLKYLNSCTDDPPQPAPESRPQCIDTKYLSLDPGCDQISPGTFTREREDVFEKPESHNIQLDIPDADFATQFEKWVRDEDIKLPKPLYTSIDTISSRKLVEVQRVLGHIHCKIRPKNKSGHGGLPNRQKIFAATQNDSRVQYKHFGPRGDLLGSSLLRDFYIEDLGLSPQAWAFLTFKDPENRTDQLPKALLREKSDSIVTVRWRGGLSRFEKGQLGGKIWNVRGANARKALDNGTPAGRGRGRRILCPKTYKRSGKSQHARARGRSLESPESGSMSEAPELTYPENFDREDFEAALILAQHAFNSKPASFPLSDPTIPIDGSEDNISWDRLIQMPESLSAKSDERRSNERKSAPDGDEVTFEDLPMHGAIELSEDKNAAEPKARTQPSSSYKDCDKSGS